MNRYRLKTAATHKVTLRDQDGTPTDATGTVTYTIKDAAGSTVGSGNASDESGTGVYGAPLTPTVGTAALGLYSVVWTYPMGGVAGQQVTTDFEVVSAHFFEVQDLRDEFKPELDSTSTFPGARIVAVRQQVEDALERECDIAFQPRARRVTLDGTGSADIFVPDIELRKVVSASIGGTALTAGELADLYVYPHGLIRRKSGAWTSGHRNVVITYEHGLDAVPPRAKREAMVWARELLKARQVPDRATSLTTDEGSFELGLPTSEAATGIPSVDAFIRGFKRDRPAVG